MIGRVKAKQKLWGGGNCEGEEKEGGEGRVRGDKDDREGRGNREWEE